MSFKEIVYKSITVYFVLVTCITAGIAILGTFLDPEAQFGYSSYFSPFIFAALGIVPNLLMYSKNELSNKQIILRKILQLLIIEAEVVGVAILSPMIPTERGEIIIGLAICVLVIFLVVNLISIFSNYLSAKQLTKELAEFRRNIH